LLQFFKPLIATLRSYGLRTRYPGERYELIDFSQWRDLGRRRMNVGDFRLLLARTRLAMAGKDLHPRTLQEARETGKALADALIKKLALSTQEAAILTQVVDTEVIFLTTPRNAVRKGLEELICFRSARRKMKGSLELKVAFIPASQWLEEWRGERRLAIIFEPAMPPSSDSLEPPSVDVQPRGFQPNSLALTNLFNDFPQVVKGRPESLRHIRFLRRNVPFLWEGSHFKIAEEKTPYDSGRGPVPTSTSIDATGDLAAPTYDFLSNQLRAGENLISEGETIWLAISFPFAGDKIPQRRDVGPNGVVPDPGLIV
jgi:hypothetical protein